MNIKFAAMIGGAALLVSFQTRAAPVFRTFDLLATDFIALYGGAIPYNTVTGSFTVSLDPRSGDFQTRTTGVTLNNLSILLGSPISYSYFPSYGSVLFVGGEQSGAGGVDDSDKDFAISISDALYAPIPDQFTYTVGNSGVLYDAGDITLTSEKGKVSNGPPGSTVDTLGGDTPADAKTIDGHRISNIESIASGKTTNQYFEFYWHGGNFEVSANLDLTNDLNIGDRTVDADIELLSSSDQLLSSTPLSDGIVRDASLYEPEPESCGYACIGYAGGPLAAGDYIIGVKSGVSADPPLEISFGAPVRGAVPEPTTWEIMLLGIGSLGLTLRGVRRRPTPVAAGHGLAETANNDCTP